MPDSHSAYDSAVHNGASTRPRRRRSATVGDFAESHHPQCTGIKRWDGRAKTSFDWDCLHQDPDLWFRNGNCHVHLYERGQFRRGPAFKVPFSALLAAQCHPLVERFAVHAIPATPEVSESSEISEVLEISDSSNTHESQLSTPPDHWTRARRVGRVDLYIPPPAGADLDQILGHHVAIRNLFAWLFRRPLVGEHLGPALTSLLNAMRDLRSADNDNVKDLLAYIGEEGYLQMTGQPAYAMGVLQLAEATQSRELYVEAFAHCVGMYNHLYLGTEYSHISATSRRLIRRARLEMDMRLGTVGKMLKNFLDDELSETYLGLTTAARAHLDRFRTYIFGYYTTRLGYYPPVSIDLRSTIFEPRICQSLASDFKALYDYLVDEEFTIASDSPALAQGGVCVLQSVESFDERHGFPSLAHPLPLLPQISSPSAVAAAAAAASRKIAGDSKSGSIGRRRRLAWFGGRAIDRLMPSRAGRQKKPSKRLLAQAALLRSTNASRPEVLQNELVWAYRRFEEESALSPAKADRGEKISMVDARKVRWIFIYAVHQALQNNYLRPPPEVHNAGAVPYHISISTANLPPWQDEVEKRQQQPPYPISRRLTIISTSSYSAGASPDRAEVTEDGSNRSSSDRIGQQIERSPVSPSRSLTLTPGTLAVPNDDGGGDGYDDQRAKTPEFSVDICPDIDYLGLANRRESVGVENISNSSSSSHLAVLPRTRSLTSNLSRNTAIRRSLILFRSNSTRPRSVVPDEQEKQELVGLGSQPRQQHEHEVRPVSRGHTHSPYHEILVHGYGNGMNIMNGALHSYSSSSSPSDDGRQTGAMLMAGPVGEGIASPTTARALSTASTNSNASTASDASATTAASALTTATTISSDSETRKVLSSSAATAKATTGDVSAEAPTVSTTSAPLSSSSISIGTGASESGSSSDRCSFSLYTSPTPAIPARNRPKSCLAVTIPPSLPAGGGGGGVSRCSSVYSPTFSPSYSPLSLTPTPVSATTPTPTLTLTPTPTPPPVPHRSSARSQPRRFSVYGGGDEYAGFQMPHRSNSSPSTASKVPRTSSMEQLPQQREQRERREHRDHRDQWNLQVPPTVFERPRSSHQPQKHFRRLDMVQEVLLAIRESRESLQAGPLEPPESPGSPGSPGSPISPRSLEPSVASASAMDATKGKSAIATTTPARRGSYHVGYHVPRVSDVQPEWEKFSMGLGGHTVLS